MSSAVSSISERVLKTAAFALYAFLALISSENSMAGSIFGILTKLSSLETGLSGLKTVKEEGLTGTRVAVTPPFLSEELTVFCGTYARDACNVAVLRSPPTGKDVLYAFAILFAAVLARVDAASNPDRLVLIPFIMRKLYTALSNH